MKPKIETVFRVSAFLLVALLFWAVWSSAQTPTEPSATNQPLATVAGTNAPTDAQTNRASLLAEGLSRLHVDYLTFGLDRVAFLQEHAVLGQPLWKYLASLIYILAAFYVSKLLDYLTNRWLKHWAAKTHSRFNELLLRVLRGPVKVVAFVIFLHIGLDVFNWGPLAQSLLSKGLIVVVACSLTYVALRLIDLLVGVWRQRTVAGTDKTFDEQLFPVISMSLKIFAVIVAVLVTSSNLGINITAALASLSVGALAVGLAAQDTLANLFGAVAVYMDKPFRIGDRIKLESVEGTVESIGLRSTRVRSLDGHHVTIPNKTVGNATITNITRRPNIRTEMNFGLTYDTPAGKVRRAVQLLEETYRAHPLTGELVISFNKFGDSALNLLAVHVWNGTDYNAYLAGMQELNLKIKERFDAEGISFAFPTQTVYLRQETEWRAAENAKS